MHLPPVIMGCPTIPPPQILYFPFGGNWAIDCMAAKRLSGDGGLGGLTCLKDLNRNGDRDGPMGSGDGHQTTWQAKGARARAVSARAPT